MEKSEYQNIYLLEESRGWYQGMKDISISLLERFLVSKRNLLILDAGCGTGLMLLEMQRFGNSFGVDISPEAIKFCKKRGLLNIKLGSVNRLPFKNDTFDLVTSFDVIYSRGVDWEKALQEFHRVLKNNGILLLRVPAFEFLRGGHDKFVHSVKRFSRPELTKSLEKSGFKIEFGTYANMFLLPVVLIMRIFSNFKRTPISEITKLPSLLNQVLLILLIFEGKLIKIFPLPLGVSLIIVARKP